jgi:branched-chain amino acid transport system permease protein
MEKIIALQASEPRVLPGRARASGLKAGMLAALAAIAIALPFVCSDFRLFQVTMVVVYAVALMGLNILTGYNGQISLGHGAFYAIGGYTSAILMSRFNVPFWATFPVSGIVCLLVGYAFGRPALRLQGLYLALATFALALALPQLLKAKAFDEWTKGVSGIVLDKPDAPAGIPLTPDQWLYFVFLLIAAALFIAAWNLMRGSVGKALVAIREHPTAAESMGIDLAHYKSMTFGVSAMYTGVAGSMSAVLTAYVNPDSFGFFLSISFLVGAVVGGLSSISGPLFGAIFIQFVPNFAENISKAAPWAIYGVFMIASMYLMRDGVAGFLRNLDDRIGRRAMPTNARPGQGAPTQET